MGKIVVLVVIFILIVLIVKFSHDPVDKIIPPSQRTEVRPQQPDDYEAKERESQKKARQNDARRMLEDVLPNNPHADRLEKQEYDSQMPIVKMKDDWRWLDCREKTQDLKMIGIWWARACKENNLETPSPFELRDSFGKMGGFSFMSGFWLDGCL